MSSLSIKRILQNSRGPKKRGPRKPKSAATNARGSSSLTGSASVASDESLKHGSRPHAPKDAQSFSFVLTKGREAHLVVPRELSVTDILIIKKQIEMLELQVEALSSVLSDEAVT